MGIMVLFLHKVAEISFLMICMRLIQVVLEWKLWQEAIFGGHSWKEKICETCQMNRNTPQQTTVFGSGQQKHRLIFASTNSTENMLLWFSLLTCESIITSNITYKYRATNTRLLTESWMWACNDGGFKVSTLGFTTTSSSAPLNCLKLLKIDYKLQHLL